MEAPGSTEILALYQSTWSHIPELPKSFNTLIIFVSPGSSGFATYC
jgi:hypothetical protein